MLLLIIVIAAVLLLSGFFSGAEAALVSLTPAEAEAGAHARFGGNALRRIYHSLQRSVMAIVIFNNIVNIVGSVVVGQIVNQLYGNAALAIVTTGLTFGVIIFSEILPKSVGIHHAHTIAPIVSPAVRICTLILLPLILLLEQGTKLFMRGGARKVGTEQQIRSLANMGRRAGHIEGDEGQLIHRVFILNDKTAGDVMTPLKDILGFETGTSLKEAAEKMRPAPYSRYPVFGNSIHDIVGIVLRNDILETLAHSRKPKNVDDLLRHAVIVPADTPCDHLLRLFRDRKTHLAVVQDNDHTAGIVTLEDVLEELVGDIEDETDTDE